MAEFRVSILLCRTSYYEYLGPFGSDKEHSSNQAEFRPRSTVDAINPALPIIRNIP